MQSLRDLATEPGSTGLSRQQLDERVSIEWEHDPNVTYPTLNMCETERFRELCEEHADRCGCCGEVIGEVDRCPSCGSQQRFAGQRHQAKRKTIGGFCKGKK
jgi:hypothetical protein